MSPRKGRPLAVAQAPFDQCGFTLIELLAVIAIVGLLLAVTVPAVQGVRESARKTECLDHLHQLAIALQHHESTFGHLPKDNDKGWGVLAFLLPEIEQKPLYDQLQPQQRARGSLAPALQSLLKTEIPVLWCPSYPKVEEPTLSGESRTSYLGSEGLFSKRMTLSDVIDGESQTLAFGETTAEQGWSQPGLGTSGGGPNQGSFGSYHPGGVQIVLCDGQARFVSDSVDANAFVALCTPQGRDVVGGY
ncbi:MAG: DUF1559 domain-containing protein [Planctomycetaceae bacterium]